MILKITEKKTLLSFGLDVLSCGKNLPKSMLTPGTNWEGDYHRKTDRIIWIHIPLSIVVLELLLSGSDAKDEVRDKWSEYCLWIAQYKSRAGIVSVSLWFKSGESGSNPNPSSMQPLSSSRSSFVMLLLRGMRSTDRFFFFLSQASLRFTSCDHECCLVRSLGGCAALWLDIVVVRSFIL